MSKVRVLIIDDSLTIRAILEGIMAKHPDIELVGAAGDVEEARATLTQRRPDVITLDLALPGTDGMTFLGELAEGPHAPVLVVSSSTTDGAAATAQAIAAGALACFDKAQLVRETDRFVKALRRAARQHQIATQAA
jgi:chemotaxis response regulator CheB